MSNPNAPFGLKPIKHLNGNPWNGKFTKYAVASTDAQAIFIGDPVTLTGTANALGIPYVAQAVAGGRLAGVCIGVEGVEYGDEKAAFYRIASKEMYIYVVDDPDVIFEIQEDSVGGALAVTKIGENADIINMTSGSTTTGLSATMLDSSDTNADSTTQPVLRIMRLVQDDARANAVGDYARWEVLINSHQFRANGTGV